MVFSQFLLPAQLPLQIRNNRFPISVRKSRHDNFSTLFSKTQLIARAEQGSNGSVAADALSNVKHVLLPITDRNPYLSEGTKQAASTTAALAKRYGADITVVVIDEKSKESIPEYEAQLSSVRWHLSEGLFPSKVFGKFIEQW